MVELSNTLQLQMNYGCLLGALKTRQYQATKTRTVLIAKTTDHTSQSFIKGACSEKLLLIRCLGWNLSEIADRLDTKYIINNTRQLRKCKLSQKIRFSLVVWWADWFHRYCNRLQIDCQ